MQPTWVRATRSRPLGSSGSRLRSQSFAPVSAARTARRTIHPGSRGMPITLKTIQVVASNGNGVGGNIPQALSNYAAALNQRSPQQVVFQGNPFLDNLALDAAFLMKVAGSGGLENDV